MAYAADFFDGSHRMYVRSADGDCSTQLRLSSGFTGDPHWSPDSEWIAFTQSQSSTFGTAPYIGNIHTARRDGSTLVNLTGSQATVSFRCAHPLVYRTGPDPEPFSISSVMQMSDGSILLEWDAIGGLLYQVEYSTDLVTWFSDLPDSAILAGNEDATLSYQDQSAQGLPRRYYRVISSSP